MQISKFQPCSPTRGTKVPAGPDWLHEVKHDGFRMIVQRDSDRVRLFTGTTGLPVDSSTPLEQRFGTYPAEPTFCIGRYASIRFPMNEVDELVVAMGGNSICRTDAGSWRIIHREEPDAGLNRSSDTNGLSAMIHIDNRIATGWRVYPLRDRVAGTVPSSREAMPHQKAPVLHFGNRGFSPTRDPEGCE